MEQVRKRGEPDTNSDSGGKDTITSGLGTGGEIHSFYMAQLQCSYSSDVNTKASYNNMVLDVDNPGIQACIYRVTELSTHRWLLSKLQHMYIHSTAICVLVSDGVTYSEP